MKAWKRAMLTMASLFGARLDTDTKQFMSRDRLEARVLTASRGFRP